MIGTIILYNFIFISSSFCVWLSTKNYTLVIKKTYLFLGFLIVFIPAAIRYYIAEDYFGYVSIFDRISNGVTTYVEFGFDYLIKSIQFFDGNVQWLFVITSFLIYLFLFKSYKNNKNSYLIHMSFFMIFYLESYSVIRAAIAICMVMYATNIFIRNKSILKPIIYVVIASLFHKSALLTLPIFLISNDRFIVFFNKYKINYFMIFLLILIYFFRVDFVNYILNSSLISALGYTPYLSSEVFMQELEFKTGFAASTKAFFLIAPLFFYESTRMGIREKYIYTMFIYLCFISFSMSLVYFIFMRFNYIFIAGFFYSFVLIVNIKSRSISRFFLISGFLFYFILFQLFIIVNTSNKCASTRINPYVSIFNKESDKSIKLVYEDCIKVYGHD